MFGKVDVDISALTVLVGTERTSTPQKPMTLISKRPNLLDWNKWKKKTTGNSLIEVHHKIVVRMEVGRYGL